MGVSVIFFTPSRINGMLKKNILDDRFTNLLYHSVARQTSVLNRVPIFVC